MEEKKNKKFNILNVLIGVFIILFLFFLLVPYPLPHHSKEHAHRIICKNNMQHLVKLMLLMQKENNEGDLSSKEWQSFKKLLNSENNYFLCPADKIGQHSYMENENIPRNLKKLPRDFVILFEGYAGEITWGGPDDVVTDRHGEKNPGANIAFADGHVEFVKPEDIPTLRWTVDK